MIATASLRSFRVISKRGVQTVETPLSDYAARDICASLRDDFARDLAVKYPYLSSKQLAWMHVLAFEAHQRRNATPAPAPRPAPVVVGGLGKIRDLLILAGGKLKHPKIRLSTQSAAYILYVAGIKSGSHAGDVAIKEKDRYTLGWVDAVGVFTPHPQANLARHPDLIPLLKALSASPTDAAKIYGKLTGNCCFCGLPLTDPRSTGAGYGPICADNWGLPWGVETISEDCPLITPPAQDTPVQHAQQPLPVAPGTLRIDASKLTWDWLSRTLQCDASSFRDVFPVGTFPREVDVMSKTLARFLWAEDIWTGKGEGRTLAGVDYTFTPPGGKPITLRVVND